MKFLEKLVLILTRKTVEKTANTKPKNKEIKVRRNKFGFPTKYEDN